MEPTSMEDRAKALRMRPHTHIIQNRDLYCVPLPDESMSIDYTNIHKTPKNLYHVKFQTPDMIGNFWNTCVIDPDDITCGPGGYYTKSAMRPYSNSPPWE